MTTAAEVEKTLKASPGIGDAKLFIDKDAKIF